MRRYWHAFFCAIALCVHGCAIGYNTTFFMTKTNFGLDVETKPPTAEISIARREGVIEPTFDSQTLPVAAGFRGASNPFSSYLNPFSSYLFGVSSVFAGGDAAVIVTDLSNTDPHPSAPSHICLKQKPIGSFLWWKSADLAPQENQVRPLFFGTDTIFGLKVAWDGMTSEIPDTVKVGFHRKEVAIAPVNGRTVTINCTMPGQEKVQEMYEVWMAPFLAWIDVNVNTGKPSDTKFDYAQGFATGIAANNWAAIPKVKNLVLKFANPSLAEAVNFNTDPGADPLRKRIATWLRTEQSNRTSLKLFLVAQNYAGNETGAEVSWLYSAPVEQLQAAIVNFNIP